MPETSGAFAIKFVGLQAAHRALVIVPGRSGESILQELPLNNSVVLDSSPQRLALAKGLRVLGQARRLPFIRHSFDVILSFEALYSIRPPWTVLAEFHRVLVPDGKLILLEPRQQSFLSTLRERIAGPGKRIYGTGEVRNRLARADFLVEDLQDDVSLAGFSHPAYAVRAIKKENPAEPVPQFMTAREMIEARKKKFPKGEELP